MESFRVYVEFCPVLGTIRVLGEIDLTLEL